MYRNTLFESNCPYYTWILKYVKKINKTSFFLCIQGLSQNNTNAACLRELVKCVDRGKRDYSFFNPQRLAKWKGPKEWKTQAMSKALKSINQSK